MKLCAYIGCDKGENGSRKQIEGHPSKKYCCTNHRTYAGIYKWQAKKQPKVTAPPSENKG